MSKLLICNKFTEKCEKGCVHSFPHTKIMMNYPIDKNPPCTVWGECMRMVDNVFTRQKVRCTEYKEK